MGRAGGRKTRREELSSFVIPAGSEVRWDRSRCRCRRRRRRSCRCRGGRAAVRAAGPWDPNTLMRVASAMGREVQVQVQVPGPTAAQHRTGGFSCSGGVQRLVGSWIARPMPKLSSRGAAPDSAAETGDSDGEETADEARLARVGQRCVRQEHPLSLHARKNDAALLMRRLEKLRQGLDRASQ